MQQIDITRIHPSVKEVIADIVYSGDDFRLDIQTFEIHHVRHQTDGEKPTHYYVVIKFRDPEETPATCILSYSEVYDYASRTASSYDKSNNCFTRGPWKEYFDRMAILYAIRKAYFLCKPKINALDLMHDGKILLPRCSEILNTLAEAGMREDDTEPYTYFIPSTMFFDVGRGTDQQLRAPYAILAMAKAAYTEARFAGIDSDGYPDEDVERGMVRVTVYDPFAQRIEEAVRNWQNSEIVKGNARIVNGKFYKVA